MKKSSVEVAIGLFVVVGLVCVGYLTIKLGKMELLGSDYYFVNARFQNVAGLKVGAQIEMAGVQIGQVDGENPYFKLGTQVNGHEFHYSAIKEFDENIESALSVIRGNGCFNERDGLVYKNVFASYFHIHALATPEWVTGMIKCARNYRNNKNNTN